MRFCVFVLFVASVVAAKDPRAYKFATEQKDLQCEVCQNLVGRLYQLANDDDFQQQVIISRRRNFKHVN